MGKLSQEWKYSWIVIEQGWVHAWREIIIYDDSKNTKYGVSYMVVKVYKHNIQFKMNHTKWRSITKIIIIINILNFYILDTR